MTCASDERRAQGIDNQPFAYYIAAMSLAAPHFLLFSEAGLSQAETGTITPPVTHRGQWRFTLQAVDGTSKVTAGDRELEVHGERLELLAVVRGLEALDQPSRVTLVTPSRYVSRGIRSGLDDWRANDWRWERYGQLAPIRHCDLWRRVDRALEFHQVECRTCRRDELEAVSDLPENPPADETTAHLTLPEENSAA